jgi:hypothetical protein
MKSAETTTLHCKHISRGTSKSRTSLGRRRKSVSMNRERQKPLVSTKRCWTISAETTLVTSTQMKLLQTRLWTLHQPTPRPQTKLWATRHPPPPNLHLQVARREDSSPRLSHTQPQKLTSCVHCPAMLKAPTIMNTELTTTRSLTLTLSMRVLSGTHTHLQHQSRSEVETALLFVFLFCSSERLLGLTFSCFVCWSKVSTRENSNIKGLISTTYSVPLLCCECAIRMCEGVMLCVNG